MSSFRELVDEVVDNIDKTTDFAFVKRVESLVAGMFSTILVQEYQKTGKMSIDCMATIQVDMEKVDDNDIHHLGLDVSEYKVYKTKIKIPQPLKIKIGTAFSYVGTTDNTKAYSKINPEELNMIMSERFGDRFSYYSYINEFIYTYNSVNKKLNIRYIPSDIREVSNISASNSAQCVKDINIPLDTRRLIKRMIYEELPETLTENQEVKISEAKND